MSKSKKTANQLLETFEKIRALELERGALVKRFERIWCEPGCDYIGVLLAMSRLSETSAYAKELTVWMRNFNEGQSNGIKQNRN